jgi:hypothetical protein
MKAFDQAVKQAMTAHATNYPRSKIYQIQSVFVEPGASPDIHGDMYTVEYYAEHFSCVMVHRCYIAPEPE